MKNKKAFELQFSWIFAVIVGAMVFFLMIYFAVKLIRLGSHEQSTELGAEISILLEPFGTTLEETKKANIEFPSETRIYNKCLVSGTFGSQYLATSIKSFGKWQEKGAEIPVKSQYIFSGETEEGKKVYIFSKPFEMPFKIADIILLSSRQYCFIDPPESAEDEIQESNLDNIKINNCSSQDTRVCFNSRSVECDMSVYGNCYNCEDEFETGYVIKNTEKMYYAGPLLYAAIIADKEIYECNAKRLMLRLSQLSLMYKNKAEFLAEKCNPEIAGDMLLFYSLAANSSSENLPLVKEFAKKIENKNDAAKCNIF